MQLPRHDRGVAFDKLRGAFSSAAESVSCSNYQIPFSDREYPSIPLYIIKHHLRNLESACTFVEILLTIGFREFGFTPARGIWRISVIHVQIRSCLFSLIYLLHELRSKRVCVD